MIGSREPLEVQPVVVGAHVRIHQGTKRIKLRNFVAGGEHLVHGFLALAWGEANQQGERLGAAQGFASGPLREGGAENLRTGPFGEHFDLEAIQHGVACFAQAEIRGAKLREMRAESFRPHAGALDFRANFGGQSGADGFERVVGDTSERGIVSRGLATLSAMLPSWRISDL